MTTRNTHEWTVAEVRDAAITNEHPIPLRVRDMLNAYADDLDRRAEGVTEDVCRQVLAKLPLYAASTPIEMVRAALLAVWPVAAEPVAQGEVAAKVVKNESGQIYIEFRHKKSIASFIGAEFYTAPPINLAAVREVIAELRESADGPGTTFVTDDDLLWYANKLEAAIGDKT